jgi:predicted transglutaminase-like cysteine proteinase
MGIRKNKDQEPKPKKKGPFLWRHKKGVCLTLVAGAIFGGGVYVGTDLDNILPLPADTKKSAPAVKGKKKPAEAKTLTAFGDTAKKKSPYLNPSQWAEAVRKQRALAEDPAYAKGYDAFLAKVESFRGQSFGQMAQGVNALVNDMITYQLDPETYNTDEYWAAAAETVRNRVGDCEDFATLQYFALRHLGVPDSRLFLAMVDSTSDGQDVPDHVVLLFNKADKGQKPDLVVLNNGGDIASTDAYAKGGLPGWKDPYTFYLAMNQNGYWEVKSIDEFSSGAGKAPTAKKSPGLK